MGTNYYAIKKVPTCKEPIHIGKSSVGWLFLFNENEYWHSYGEVKAWLEANVNSTTAEYVIIDEYDRIIDYKELIDKIDTKQKDPRNLKNPDNFSYARNVNGYRFAQGYFS